MREALFTVADAADRLAVAECVVLAHIRAGRLVAVNVGLGLTRPRWRIAPDAIDDFLAARAMRPPVPAARSKRKRMEAVTEYF